MSRSPIEIMIDTACGYDPDAPLPRPAVKLDDAEVQAVYDVCEAAAVWVQADSAGDAEAALNDLRLKARALVAAGW